MTVKCRDIFLKSAIFKFFSIIMIKLGKIDTTRTNLRTTTDSRTYYIHN